MKYILLYQNGLANVFDSNFHRVHQGSFVTAEWFCRGLQQAGKSVDVMHCDKLGDAARVAVGEWRSGPGDMFAEQKATLD